MLGFLTNIFELLAAFAGFYYLSKNKNSRLRSFVYFLVITVLVDALGTYANLYNTLDFLKPIENTIFKENFWLYNTFQIGSLFFYMIFYRSLIVSDNYKKLINLLIILSVFVIAYNIYVNGLSYFTMNIKYNFIWTTFCVFMCIALYFYELLMSDEILLFFRSTLFYISIGLLLWWLIFPPFIFYMQYYKTIYPEMMRFRDVILICTNLYLYGCFIIGFLWAREH